MFKNLCVALKTMLVVNGNWLCVVCRFTFQHTECSKYRLELIFEQQILFVMVTNVHDIGLEQTLKVKFIYI